MKKFDIRLVKNHLLFDYEGKVILVDTGAPVSFMRGGDTFNFMGRNYRCNPSGIDMIRKMSGLDLADLPHLPGMPTPEEMISRMTSGVMPGGMENYIPEASEFVGEQIDVMMGTDILGDYRAVIDYLDKSLTLYENDEDVPDEWKHSQPLFFARDGHIGMDVVLNGRPARVAIDSGAVIQYVDRSFTRGITPVDSVKDFHHDVGEFTTDLCPMELQADGDTLEVKFGNLPEILQCQLSAGGFDGVIGWDFLSQRKVMIDFHNKTINWD